MEQHIASDIQTVNGSESNTSGMSPEVANNTIALELGDIVEIIAPTNPELHEITMYISYISPDVIQLTNITSLKPIQLNIREDGQLTDESIQQINLLNRSNEKGYSRQNSLVPNTWVHIHFGGEIPVIITGEITNLEEDMIEVITYPELKTIYIDFQYQGIPRDIPIESIVIGEKPAALIRVGSLSLIRDSLEEGEEFEIPDEELADIKFNDMGEAVITIPEGSKEVKNMKDMLHEIYVDANTIVFGEEMSEIAHVVEVPASERRYGIDEQVDDMMDELLSTIPNTNRSKLVMNNIHNLIERFVELRERFSLIDDNNNVYGATRFGDFYKPLIQRIVQFDTNLRWVIPIVMNKRKLYDLEVAPTNNDILSETSYEVLSNISNIQMNYRNAKNTNQTNTYSSMHNNLHYPLIPFDRPDNTEDCLKIAPVLVNLDAIVDNLEDFASSVYAQSGIAKRKYLIQRYNMGLTKIAENIMKTGKKVYTRANMTPNDGMCLKSIMVMPSSVIKFSTIHLPGTNILDRATMHSNYLMLFRLFKKNVEITPHVIDDLSKELDYEQMEAKTKQDLFSGLHEFVLNKESYVDVSEQLDRFMEVIIPKTRLIFKLFRKHLQTKLTFQGIISQLEAFAIYPANVSYKQYQDVRGILREEIIELRKRIEQKSNEIGVLNNARYMVDKFPNPITRIFDQNEKLRELFRNGYNFSDDEMSVSSVMLRMLDNDNGKLYTNMIKAIMISLISPTGLLAALSDTNIDDTSEEDRIQSSDCATRYLAKKYTSVRALQNDNNVDELYFDKEMDDTPYDILQKYKQEQQTMEPELFLEYLIANLINKHHCPKDQAPDLAKALIANKKIVQDGNYAILEVRPQLPSNVNPESLSENDKANNEIESEFRKKIIYFRRLRGNWVKDDDINPESFLDTNALFCNIHNACLKNQQSKICESDIDARIRIKNVAKDELVAEFNARTSKTVDELEKELTDEVKYQLKLIRRIHILREVQLYKANNLAHALGNYANNISLIHSPHEPLKTAIMAYPDFQSKQKYICQFVEEKCREAMVANLDEDINWFYCKDTNVKLFPRSLYELAVEFVLGKDYQAKLEEVCARVGMLSDDQDSIIDKHSGAVLRRIDFVNEDMFDESGFKITSHAIMEKELGDIVMDVKTSKKVKRVFDSEITEEIYNISNTICRNIDIPLDNMEEFVLRISNELVIKDILSESAYKRRSEASMNKTGKALPPYINYKREMTILIVSSVLIVAIQTTIPGFGGSKSFPGCVRSFTGYPFGGVEDLTSIQYVACVLSKIKSSISPWNAIQKYKVDKIASRIKDVLDKSVVSLSEIIAVIAQKREYDLLHPTTSVPAEHAITKWIHCLPPIVDFNILKTLKPLSSDFKEDILNSVRRGNAKQDDMIQVLKGKIVQHGYGLIESINAIVKSKDLLLKTSTEIPFLENACCHDSTNMLKPMLYFNSEDANIRLLLQRVFSMTKLLKTVRSLNHASMFYHPTFTGIKHPDIPSGHLEENVYAAVIHYCNFDKKLPIPEEFKTICNEKPAQYKSSWSLLEKMESMKKNGKRYNIDSLHKLMTIVNQKNMVSIDTNQPTTKVHILAELLERLDTLDSPVIDERLRTHLRNVLHQYNPLTASEIASKELNDLTNYLTVANKKTYLNIMGFFHSHGKLAPSVYKNVNQYIANIANWKIDSENMLYSFAQFIQNSIHNISKFYPTMLINNTSGYTHVPPHWNLSSNHVVDVQTFMDKYYSNLASFRQDRIVIELVNEIRNVLVDMMLFVENIPIYSDIVKDQTDEDGNPIQVRFHSLMPQETLVLLLTHCYYQCIYQYVSLSDDPELLQVDVYQSKVIRRNKNEDMMDASLQLRAQEVNDESIAEMVDDLNEVNISTVNTAELKKRVADLLVSMFNIESSTKTTVDLSYEDVMKKVMRSREKEKLGIIRDLGKMSIQERKVEDQFKQYKLGRWNIGKQKGLVSYDKETYERERGEIIGQMSQEMTEGGLDVVSEMRRDIYDMEQDEQDEAAAEDAVDIRDLGENYMDGNYYPEDNDGEEDF